MKRDFLLNDQASCRDPSGWLVTLFTYVTFLQSGGKPDNRDEGFHATIMNYSVDKVKEKDITFLQGNFDKVRCSKMQKV